MIARFTGVLLAVLATAGVSVAEPTVLQYKFDKAEILKYDMTMTTEAKFQTPDGGTRTTKMSNFMQLSQELIEKKADGTYRVAVTINKAEQKVDGKPVQIPVAIGHSILLTMKPNGAVVEGSADLPSAGGQPPLQMVFPDKAVGEKETWEQQAKIQQPVQMETKTLYSVENTNQDLPGYEGKVVAIKSSMGMDNQKTPTGEAVNFKTDGKIWFDGVRGRIVKSRAQSVFHIAIPVNLQSVLPPNSVVKIDLQIDIEIKLVK
jgi:hypothetical protein